MATQECDKKEILRNRATDATGLQISCPSFFLHQRRFIDLFTDPSFEESELEKKNNLKDS